MRDPAPPRNVRLLSALLLVATFAFGSVTGVGLTLWARSDLRHGPPPGPPAFGPLPLHELGLSPEQHQQADAIFERHRPELDAILEEGFPKVRRINEQIESEVREILTPDQRTRLDEWKARRPPPRHGPPFPGSQPPGPHGGPRDGFGRPPPPPPGEHGMWPPPPPEPPTPVAPTPAPAAPAAPKSQ